MFFPDVPKAVQEMARVGAEARTLLDTYWSQGDLEALCSTLSSAGLLVEETRTRLGTATYDSVEDLVEIEVRGTPLADRVTDEQIAALVTELNGSLKSCSECMSKSVKPLVTGSLRFIIFTL